MKVNIKMKNKWNIINHPLAKNYLTIIRNKETSHKVFVDAVEKITRLTVYPVTNSLKTKETTITTPFKKIKSSVLTTKVSLIPVVRAGLSMVNAYTEILENFKIGHILLQREKKINQIKNYFCKLPALNHQDDNRIIILEPMIATANSLKIVIDNIKNLTKIKNENIIIVTFIISKYAQTKIEKAYQNLNFFVIKIDPQLNSKNYIVPGLGDAGDRFFNT